MKYRGEDQEARQVAHQRSEKTRDENISYRVSELFDSEPEMSEKRDFLKNVLVFLNTRFEQNFCALVETNFLLG